MNTFRFIGFAIFAILMCLSACSGGGDDPIEPTPKPEVTKSEITIDSSIISNGLSFSNAGGDQSISFTTNENWTLSVASTTSGANWCTASATSGSKGNVNVKFTVTENTDYDNRSVSVTIKSGTVSETFTITQKSADALLVTTNKYEIAQEGGTIEIEVKANIDYKMEISEKAKEWIKESSGRGLTTYKHTLNIAANGKVEKREGEIYFKSGDKEETVKIYQEAGEAILLLSQSEYSVGNKGDTISVDIKSNIEFGIQMPDVDWIIDEASSRGMSSHTLKFVVIPNETYDNRSAEIIFYDKNSGLKDTLKVIQAQKDAIILSRKQYEVSSDGEIIEVKLSTNVDFDVQMPDVDWIIDEASSRGMSSHTLKYIIGCNENNKSREAEIIFFDKNSDIKDTLSIKQSGVFLIIGNNLSMHPEGIALQFTGVTDLYDFFEAKYDKMICKDIYSKFEDVFDFVMFLYNTDGEEFTLGGFSYDVNINIEGIGVGKINESSQYGSKGYLKGIKHLTLRTSLFSAGPFLHELLHYWGAVNIGQEYATENGTYKTDVHWGTSDINGVLGGFDYNTLKRNVDGNSQKYWATSTRAQEWGFDGFSQELSNGYFAPLELYLMGLLPSDSVPDMHVFNDVTVENNTWGDGTFYAKSEKIFTMEDFIKKYGVRKPDYTESQKDFRALIVVVTDKPVSNEHWTLIKNDLLKQETQGAVNDKKQTNFWEATGGRATLTLSGIDKFLKQ